MVKRERLFTRRQGFVSQILKAVNWFSLAHKSEKVYNLRVLLNAGHYVRMYFTRPHSRGKIFHFAGSDHRRILEL